MSASSRSVRVRFAPSPTGHLHIGGLRTAIFNWLFARHHDGAFLIRIEDTDLERSKDEYTQSILGAFSWLGIESDEPIVTQSERLAQHTALIEQLLKAGKAYHCYCTPQEVEQRHVAAGGDPAFLKYDGHCRLDQGRVGSGLPFVIRFAIPNDVQTVTINDLIRGEIVVGRDQLDDFIIARPDGRPMYNFVVVADDAAADISHIIRGEEHISNTPKQILLYQALGYAVPQFAHLPMILGQSGKKLSKRDAATSVLDYKRDGYLPNALLNYLVRLGWAHGDQEIFAKDELIECFTLSNVQKKGAVFDPEKLNWVNSVYIKQAESASLFEIMLRDTVPALAGKLGSWSLDQKNTAIDLYKDRVVTLSSMAHALINLHDGPERYAQEDIEKWINEDVLNHLRYVCDSFTSLSEWTSDLIKHAVKDVSKQVGVKLVAIAQPLRIALIGSSDGPGVFGLLAVVGKVETIRRIKMLLNHITKE